MEKTDKKIIRATIIGCVITFFAGFFGGCLLMILAHQEIVNHYNVCQESELQKNIARMADEKSYQIVTDSITGKIKIK